MMEESKKRAAEEVRNFKKQLYLDNKAEATQP